MKHPCQRGHRHERGVTLLEVLIASTIVSIAFLGFFSMQGQIIQSGDDAHRMTECQVLAESKMEQLRSIQWCATSGDAPSLGLADLTSGQNADVGDTALTPWTAYPHTPQNPYASGGGSWVPVDNEWSDTSADASYWVSWDVDADPDGSFDVNAMLKIKVKCSYLPKGSTDNGTHSTHKGLRIVSYHSGNDC